MTASIRIARLVVIAAMTAAQSPALYAQQANSSVAGFGMGNNYTAAARGHEAVGWNPALLGLAGRPAFSMALLPSGINAGIGPVTIEEIAKYAGSEIPAGVRQGWVSDIRSNGLQSGTFDGGTTFLALSMGRLGLHVSASGTGSMTLNGDALELILLGNADAVAQNRTLNPQGNLSGSGFVTTAMSLALPMSPSFSIGITGKHILGMGHATVGDNGSTVTADNVRLRFPMVTTVGTDAGSGIGVDAGAAWRRGGFTAGLAVTNVVNSFGWSEDNFTCTNVMADLTAADITTSTDEAPCSQFQAQTSAIAAQKFTPGLRFGLAWAAGGSWLFTADAQMQTSDAPESIVQGPKSAFGVGAEFSGIGFLPLRAGFTSITGGTQVSAGAGLRIGPLEIGGGVQLRTADGVSSANLMFGLFSIR